MMQIVKQTFHFKIAYVAVFAQKHSLATVILQKDITFLVSFFIIISM